jgi:Sulfatase-modifying factor enzyme 1
MVRTPIRTASVSSASSGISHGADGIACTAGRIPVRIRRCTEVMQTGEWCQDWYAADYYAKSPSIAPSGPNNGHSRVVRGGSWYDVARYARSAYRLSVRPDVRLGIVGFRVVGAGGVRTS